MQIKHIPGTNNFYATESGDILDSKGNKRKQYTNGDGYKTASVLLENNSWQTFGVHRLVALAHIPTTINTDDLKVNHIDTIKINNSVSNLEWVTDLENNIHSSLLKGSSVRASILCIDENNKKSLINTIEEACVIFDCQEKDIWNSIKNNTTIKNCVLKYNSSKDKTPKELHNKDYFNNIKIKRNIKIMDIFTKRIINFFSLGEAARFFNVKSNHIFNCITVDKKIRIFNRRYVIVDFYNDFPTITEKEYNSITQSLPKEVISYNFTNNSYYIYDSASKFIKYSGLSKKAVTVDLFNGRIRKLNDWIYTYMINNGMSRLKKVVDCSESTT